jgi:hypothetical protein
MASDLNVDAFALEVDPVPSAAFVEALLKTGFSPEAYRDAHHDLREFGVTATQALRHYLHHGIFESRQVDLQLNREALLELAALPLGNRPFKAQLLAELSVSMLGTCSVPFGPVIAERWATINSLKPHGAHLYFIAGDSHSSQYAIAGRRGDEWLMPLHLLCHGGSARGLGNSNSVTGFGDALRQAVQAIRSLPGADVAPFLIQFGQVDIEFVHHFHRVRDEQRMLDLDAYRWFCVETVKRYVDYLVSLFEPSWRSRVYVLSVFPPVLSDDAWRRGVLNDVIIRDEMGMTQEDMAAGIRTLEVANLQQRTAIHEHFNKLLGSACASHGFCFIDGFTPFLGADGLADQQYAQPEAFGFDHHLDARRTRPIVEEIVWTIVSGT